MSSTNAGEKSPLFDSYTKRVLIVMCIVIAVLQISVSMMAPIMPLYAQSFGVSKTAIGIALAIPYLAILFTSMPVGMIADAWGRKPVIMISGVITAIGCIISAVAPNYWIFLTGRFIGGIGVTFAYVGGEIILADISSSGNRARILGVYNGVAMATVLIGAMPGGWIAQQYGLNAPFFVAAALVFPLSIVATMGLKETRKSADPQTKQEPSTSMGAQIRTLTRHRPIMLMCFWNMVLHIGRIGGLLTLVPLLATDTIGLTASQIGLGMGAISIASLPFIWPGSIVSDQRGRKLTIIPASLIFGAAFFVYVRSSSFLMFLVACLFIAAAGGFSAGAVTAYLADFAPPGMNASIMAFASLILNAGAIIGPLLMGALADGWGIDKALVLIGVMIIVATIILTIFAPESLQKDDSANVAAAIP